MAEAQGSGGERYKIGDVCRIADVQPYVLRYWESEFPVLAPDKSVPGPRTYSGRELKLIEQIKRLLYDEGYTIAGAKKRLEAEGGAKVEAKDSPADTNPAVPALPPKTEKADRPEKPEKSEKAAPAEKAEKPEKAARAPRQPKPAAQPRSADPADFELPAPEITIPVVARPDAEPAPAEDERIASAVAELRELLAVLSRPAP